MQEYLINVQQLESKQEELEPEDYFYNQDDYVDIDKFLYEMNNPLSND